MKRVKTIRKEVTICLFIRMQAQTHGELYSDILTGRGSESKRKNAVSKLNVKHKIGNVNSSINQGLILI